MTWGKVSNEAYFQLTKLFWPSGKEVPTEVSVMGSILFGHRGQR